MEVHLIPAVRTRFRTKNRQAEINQGEFGNEFFAGGYIVDKASFSKRNGFIMADVTGQHENKRNALRVSIRLKLTLPEFEELVLGADTRWFSRVYAPSLEKYFSEKQLTAIREFEAEKVMISLREKIRRARQTTASLSRHALVHQGSANSRLRK